MAKKKKKRVSPKRRILALRAKGFTYAQIAKELGISTACVGYHLGKRKKMGRGAKTPKMISNGEYKSVVRDLRLRAEKLKAEAQGLESLAAAVEASEKR